MNYSTYNKHNFFIKKNSTLPELKYPLIQQLRDMYDITDDMLENVAVTFSMIDAESGLYHIANAPGDLKILDDDSKYLDEVKYTLTFKFKKHQTSKSGRYLGEFKVDFLGEGSCGKITLPQSEKIEILISDSITNTTVI